jgi:hypothetical protein
MRKPPAKPTKHNEPEWAGKGEHPQNETLSEIKVAVRQCDPKMLAEALRGSDGLDRRGVQIIADLLDPHSDNRLQLKFVQRRRGRPRSEKKRLRDTAVRTKVRLAHLKSKSKFENDVLDTAKEKKVSRATVFRAIAPRKPKKKRPD